MSLTSFRAWSKLPFMATTSAPYCKAWASFPMAMYPSGMRTIVLRPYLEPYAAAEAEVLPVLAHIMFLDPVSRALATAITMPLSLKEPVGFKPSYLKYRSMPKSLDRFLLRIRGVLPSYRDTNGVFSFIGK